MSVDAPMPLPPEKCRVIAKTPYLSSDQLPIATDDGIMTKEEARRLVDHKREKALVRKLDLRVLLPIAIIFFWAFVDRANIGYARLQGLEKDLRMVGNDFNVALLVQIAPYIFFEVPSNLLLKHVRPSYWLGGMSLCWGLMTLGQGLVKTYHGLIALRFFLGLFEAGLVPGAVYLTSMYYTRFELQKRLVGLYVANCVAIATGGVSFPLPPFILTMHVLTYHH